MCEVCVAKRSQSDIIIKMQYRVLRTPDHVGRVISERNDEALVGWLKVGRLTAGRQDGGRAPVICGRFNA